MKEKEKKMRIKFGIYFKNFFFKKNVAFKMHYKELSFLRRKNVISSFLEGRKEVVRFTFNFNI